MRRVFSSLVAVLLLVTLHLQCGSEQAAHLTPAPYAHAATLAVTLQKSNHHGANEVRGQSHCSSDFAILPIFMFAASNPVGDTYQPSSTKTFKAQSHNVNLRPPILSA